MPTPSWFDTISMRATATERRREDLILSLSKDEVRSQ
jgi:hypothetical protein